MHETERMAAGYKADRFRELRVRAGFDQKQLAERAGTNQGDVSRIELGKTKLAHDPSKLLRFARALGCSVADIYDNPLVGPELHLDPPEEPTPADSHAPMEAALLRLVSPDDEGPYDLRDLDVVRQTIRETAQYMEGGDPETIVRSWLRAARYFRLRNVTPSPTQVVARAQVGASVQSERAQAEATERTRAEAAALAREHGLETDGPSPRAIAARQRAAATAKKSAEG